MSNGANGHHTRCQEIGQTAVPVLPVVVFTLADHVRQQYPKLHLSDISDAMYGLKFSIPSMSQQSPIKQYSSNTIPDYTIRGWGSHGEDIDVMRIVLRDEMTAELMDEVLKGITCAVEELIDQA
jgi:hypothetical protein